MRGIVLLGLILIGLLTAPAGTSNTSLVAQWNPIEDIINKIKEAILSAVNWLADQIHNLAMGPLAPVFQAVTKFVIGNPVPEYGDWGPEEEVSWYEVRVPEMLSLYEKAKLVAYTLLPLPIVLGALSIGLEGFGLIREGEGMLMIKKSLWIAILIPLSMTLYEYSAHLLSAMTHYLCPPDNFGYYFGLTITGVGLLAFIIDPLIFLFLLVIAIAGAMRILIVAALASILPILLVLSLIPKVGDIARALIGALISLVLVQLVAGAMISMAVAIAGGIGGDDFAGSLVRIMIAFASLAIPLIAPMLMGRSGFAKFATSALLGYTVFPIFHAFRGYLITSSMGISGRGVVGWGIKVGIGASRYIYRGVTALPRLPRIIKTSYDRWYFGRHRDKELYVM